MTALARLARTRSSLEKPRILLTTVAALAQRVPPRREMAAKTFSAAPGAAVDLHELAAWLEANGFMRASTVRESGEYALRGGIVDLFPPSLSAPVRLDFFGDVLETIRAFDPESQRTTAQLRALDLVPVNEAPILTETIKRFRQSYIAHFGAQTRGDALYEAVSEGRRPAGLEHWLPLLYDKLDTLFDYIDDAPLLLDAQAEAAAHERFDQIKDYYEFPPQRLFARSRTLQLQAAAARGALSRRGRIRAGAGQDGDRAVHAVRSARRRGQDRGLRRRSGAQLLARAQ